MESEKNSYDFTFRLELKDRTGMVYTYVFDHDIIKKHDVPICVYDFDEFFDWMKGYISKQLIKVVDNEKKRVSDDVTFINKYMEQEYRFEKIRDRLVYAKDLTDEIDGIMKKLDDVNGVGALFCVTDCTYKYINMHIKVQEITTRTITEKKNLLNTFPIN